jgi:class 3 adenylate cyclase/tetratricopeptide (TPR) repeat protein
MNCPHCRHDNPTGTKFCGECGARLSASCSACGASNPPSNKFCGECGQAIQAVSPSAVPAPSAYTPKHLAEKILTSKAALEGERKQVTVLFADLKGSMELLVDRDPEEARKLLDPVLERMMEAVHRYEGTVNQVMGDGIMALFGAPLAHEDHAVRACYAALRMQESVSQYAEELRRRRGVDVQVRVGVNSGEVVVRSIGSDLHMDYTAVGQTTHLAGRLEQLARPGATLISTDTLSLSEGHIKVKSMGPVPVKGLAAPVEVFELLGGGIARRRFEATAARGLTQFVGRRHELDVLATALDRARAGHGQIVAPVGEPGVGKSRLFWEFTRSYRTHGWLVLEGGGVSYGLATPYLPVINLLKGYFQIDERDDSWGIREKVTGKLLTLDRALGLTVSAILALLNVPVDDPEWHALDPPRRRQRTLEGIKRILLRESQVQPLLLVVEDLHWIDSETQAFLDSLVESLPMARVLMLLNYRPEYQHGWGRKAYYTEVRLDPLPPESAEELLDVLLGDDPALPALKQLLIDRTEGNPFFLEESARTLIESRVLVGERGGYRLVRPIESIQVPATVQAVLAARIDRLPPDEKRLLQSASVIGKNVPLAVLQGIADVPEPDLRQSLASLQAGEFLYETRFFPELEYTFKHALTHDVAYAGMLHERRRALHAQVVDVIERLWPDRLVEHAERLVHHAISGEAWDRALVHARQAGAKAASRSLHREAVAYLDQALAALDHLPESRERLIEAVDLRLDLRNSLHPLAEHERIRQHLTVAEQLAVALDDPLRQARLLGYLSMHFGVVGPPTRALEHAERALALAANAGSLELELEMRLRVGIAQMYFDQRHTVAILRPLIACLDNDLAARHRFGLMFTAPGARGILAQSLAALGEFPEAAAVGAEALQIAETLGHRYSLAFVCRAVGIAHALQGDVARALPLFERSVELCRAVGARFILPATAAHLGLARAQDGRTAEAEMLLDEAAREASGDYEPVWALIVTASGYQRAGRLERAREVATAAMDHARARQEGGTGTWASFLLGDVAAASTPPDAKTAEFHYLAALGNAEFLGLRPLVAHCHLGLGKLYRRSGDGMKAQAHLTTAATMYREMDMGFYLAQAEEVSRGDCIGPPLPPSI